MNGIRTGSRVALMLTLLIATVALAVDTTIMPTPELQARYRSLTEELRCMKCQNNSIADSPAGLASDLRRDVKELLLAGKSDEEIRQWMVQRYGNVILFTPPLDSSTAWVWLFPGIAALAGLAIGIRIVRQRSRLVATDDSVDPEEASR
jgi:cytochrome c-type biogenesis protein CcmH